MVMCNEGWGKKKLYTVCNLNCVTLGGSVAILSQESGLLSDSLWIQHQAIQDSPCCRTKIAGGGDGSDPTPSIRLTPNL